MYVICSQFIICFPCNNMVLFIMKSQFLLNTGGYYQELTHMTPENIRRQRHRVANRFNREPF